MAMGGEIIMPGHLDRTQEITSADSMVSSTPTVKLKEHINPVTGTITNGTGQGLDPLFANSDSSKFTQVIKVCSSTNLMCKMFRSCDRVCPTLIRVHFNTDSNMSWQKPELYSLSKLLA